MNTTKNDQLSGAFQVIGRAIFPKECLKGEDTWSFQCLSNDLEST